MKILIAWLLTTIAFLLWCAWAIETDEKIARRKRAGRVQDGSQS